MIRFPSLEQLRTRGSAKWRLYDPDVLPMPVAEMDVHLADCIARTLHDAVSRSDTGYPATDGGIQAAFAAFAASRWGWAVPPDRVIQVPDVSVGSVEVLKAVSRPGTTVLISTPVYPPFRHWPSTAGLAIRDIPMLGSVASGDWRLDLPAIESAFADGAQAYLLCHPHNPLGHLHPQQELAELAAIAERHGGWVVADEIHAPLTLPGHTFTPFLTTSPAARRVGIALHSASKAWNLAGLKSALVVTDHPDAAVAVARLPPDLPWHAGHLGALAGISAFTEGVDWLDALLPILADNQRLLADELATRLPQARYRPGQAGYLGWIDMRELGWGDDPAAHALRLGRLALGIGPQFGTPGAGHARINLGCAPDLVPEAVSRLVRTGELLEREGTPVAAGAATGRPESS